MSSSYGVQKTLACSCAYECVTDPNTGEVGCSCPDSCGGADACGGTDAITCPAGMSACCMSGSLDCCTGGGGAGGVACLHQPVDCPAGWTRTNTISSVSTCGLGKAQYCGLGTAEVGYVCDTAECTGKNCDPGQIDNLYGIQVYSCTPPCTNTAPTATTLSAPANGAVYVAPSGSTSVGLSWSATADWGTECSGTTRRYDLCVGTNAGNPCTGGTTYSTSSTTAPAQNYTPAVTVGQKYWNVKAVNKAGQTSSSSDIRNFCVEGFSVTNPAYVSSWTTCSTTNHTHTRTCREDCGTDNCSAISLTEDCLGAVSGTLFDASEYSSCPSFNPTTGYLVGLPVGLGAPSRSFGFTGPWALRSPSVTDANGNYTIGVYAPGTYTYDFSPLSDLYSIGGGPKLTCHSAVADVPSNPPTCLTQPCSLVTNMSFGFWKQYGGWWQAAGASVHAEKGIHSEIPSSLSTEMSLILPDPDITKGNRVGFLSYGLPRPALMLGKNPDAQVSSKLWEKESKYSGLIYDWGFYNTRFNLFTKTAWTEGQPLTYTDIIDGVPTKGYQIFKSPSSITSFGFNPTGSQKAIFHVNGDVRVTSNITVPVGAFLAVIAKGTITFDPGVTRADGWYVAANISVPCVDLDNNGCDKTDSLFQGNGSFIGWRGFALGRTRGATNNTAPSEKFTYRQDLLLNAPKPMKVYSKFYKPFIP